MIHVLARWRRWNDSCLLMACRPVRIGPGAGTNAGARVSWLFNSYASTIHASGTNTQAAALQLASGREEKAPACTDSSEKVTAVAGQRDALASILLDSTQSMPGCLSYVIAKDPSDADGLWITEVWDTPESHKASLSLPAVQAAIAKARPIIAGFSNRVATVPIGGYGLTKTAQAG